MRFTTLSTTDLAVSAICLGTMGYGRQVAENDAHQQMDYASANGVNFFDTAEMYPIPVDEKFAGDTEEIIGRWLTKSGKRKDIVLATKVSGPGRIAMRPGVNNLDKKNIDLAIDASLKRLQTDVIDLYYLHWPDRNVPRFGLRGYVHEDDEQITPIIDTLKALDGLIKAGKIRYVGLSNETPWGTMEFLRIARENNLPRMVTVQNAYNLLNRHYDLGMAEVSMREDIGLIPYSPLGYGALGGRYLGGMKPKGSRPDVHPEFAIRYRAPQAVHATELYADLAKKHGMSLAQMSLAFVHAQPFVTSTIIGASTLDQLKEDIASIDLKLSDDALQSIEEIHELHPNIVA